MNVAIFDLVDESGNHTIFVTPDSILDWVHSELTPKTNDMKTWFATDTPESIRHAILDLHIGAAFNNPEGYAVVDLERFNNDKAIYARYVALDHLGPDDGLQNVLAALKAAEALGYRVARQYSGVMY